MKNSKYTIITTALFLIIIGFGYYIVPVFIHLSDTTAILNSQSEVTQEYTMNSTAISNRVFDPLKKETMQEQLTEEEVNEVRETARYFNITEERLPWLFDEKTVFYRPLDLDYTYSSEIVAIQKTADTLTTYVFDPYIFYILESVKRPSGDPTPAQIAAAYDKLEYDSSLISDKLTSYLTSITASSDIDSYNGTSYLSNSLYYSMYINSSDYDALSNYNYTLSYNLYDCIQLGEKTIQFDGTLFAVTYFVEQYGIILYYDPVIQEYCGYTIMDN
jgi:hypothetical protein